MRDSEKCVYIFWVIFPAVLWGYTAVRGYKEANELTRLHLLYASPRKLSDTLSPESFILQRPYWCIVASRYYDTLDIVSVEMMNEFCNALISDTSALWHRTDKPK